MPVCALTYTKQSMPKHTEQLTQWLSQHSYLGDFSIEPVSSDAGSRRYFRVVTEGESYIAMDATPEQEDCRRFAATARQFCALELNAPQVLAEDLQQGFMLLSDMGATLYLDVINIENVERLYGEAMDALLVIQTKGASEALPPYNRELLMSEMGLFCDWLVGEQLDLKITAVEQLMLDKLFALLADSALEQPQVFVHHDYRSCNLIVTPPPNPGILGFEDAVAGPVTYDLVSLLKDCHITWPLSQVHVWAESYFVMALKSGLLGSMFDHPMDWHFSSVKQQAQFIRWFDLMGVQRHLTDSGMFARFNQRDGMDSYLKHIPRTLSYIVEVTPLYEELQGIQRFIIDRVLPMLR